VKARASLIPFIIGILSAIISLVRLELGNSAALFQVLWAEDGLFPLCVRSSDALSCTAEPFAGYFLFLPRVSAILLAQFPLEVWPIGAAVTAAVVTGVLSVLIYLGLISFGMSTRGSIASALIFVLLPITGIEVLAVVGSLYQPLLVASAVLTIAAPRAKPSFMVVPLLLIVSSLTMPVTVVLAPFIILNWFWRRVGSREAFTWMVALLIGLVVQIVVIFSAEERREMDLSLNALSNFVRGFLASILTLLPGLTIGDVSLTSFTTLRPSPYLAWLTILSLGLVALLGVILGRNHKRWSVASQLVLVALMVPLISSLSGTFSFRYFVAPVARLTIALLVLIDQWISKLKAWQLIFGIALLGILWAPSFPASQLRSSPAPSWSFELSRAMVECQNVQSAWSVVTLTPAWPPDGNTLTELNLPRLRCDIFGMN